MGLIRSVSGVRGVVGRDLTPAVAMGLAGAFGRHVGGGKVAVGRDPRLGGEMLMHAAVAGLLGAGCEVVELGVVTTPGVALMVKELGCQAGIVLTASHNPVEWDGMKFLTSAGVGPPPEEAARIFALADQGDTGCVAGAETRAVVRDESTHERHIAAALRAVDADAIRQRRFRVVLDSINGAGAIVTPMLLERFGCDATVLNGEPNGRFAHTPEPLAENLTALAQAVKRHGADVGFAQDPDADRLAIVDETGRYIGEEYTLVLTAKQIWSRRSGPAATNLSTSRMIDDVAAAAGQIVIRTPVGEANVAHAMRDNGCVVGGEGNGGVIVPEVILVRNSLAGIAVILDLLAAEGRPLSHIVADQPAYSLIKQKFPCEPGSGDELIARATERFADQRIDTSDGVRVDWPQGWAHLRASNTEPIMRVFAEAKDEAVAQELIARMRDAMER